MKVQDMLACLVAGALLLPAQQTPPAAGAKTGDLEIMVIEGEGAKNNVRAHTAVAPVVEVKDAGKPVEGADVVVVLPTVGPSGSFHGWLKNQTVKTDAQGRAAVTGYQPNSEEGRFNIKVTATSGNKTGTAIIAQSNVSGPGATMSGGTKSHRNLWITLGVIGAGAVAAGVAVAAGGSDSPSSSGKVPVSVTAGPVTVAGPK
ncbi:MAG: hypothetical protein ABI972_05480 [Acidobacteriota bacterium]